MTAPTPRLVLRTYVALTLLATFASSFIWGVNTLFLLDAGLSVTQAFAANAFFTVGQVLFEVPTGVVADTLGRRVSYLLGVATLLVSTLAYLLLWKVHGPFWAWAVVSISLGLGFTFFSGATEAWLVDGLHHTGYTGTLESAFARGQIASGIAMLSGTFAGGALAQATSLGAPYLLRAAILTLTLALAFFLMRDVGFTPRRSASVAAEMRGILRASFDQGLRNPPVRWVMLGAPCLLVWAIVFAATTPVRQSFINRLIPSEQRATVLSSDNLFSSLGGVAIQPGLGRVAEAWGYPSSYLVAAGIQLLTLPFLFLARRENAFSDPVGAEDEPR